MLLGWKMYIRSYKMLIDDEKLSLYDDDLWWDNNCCMSMMNDEINDACEWRIMTNDMLGL